MRAKNSGGWNDWSDPNLFDYVDTPPSAINPIVPLVTTATATPEYSWEDPGNVTDYRLLIYDRLLKTQVHNEQYSAQSICSEGVCSVTPTDLALNYSKNHFWRIRARNSGGWNSWSDLHRFDYVDTVPETATPITPAGPISNSTPFYSWTGLSNAVEYQVLVYDRVLTEVIHNERYPAAENCTVADCAINPSIEVSEGSNHYWRVRAGNSGGWSPWSERLAFDVIGGGE